MSQLDNENSTEDLLGICFDVLNFSKTETLHFTDFNTKRDLARLLDPRIPPREIVVPPLHMATIPDSYYRGKTLSGKVCHEVVHSKGKDRPLRLVGFSGFKKGKLGFKLLTGPWLPVPLNHKAWAEIEKIKGGGRPLARQ